MSQNKKNTSRLIKKLGITFVIPFLMLIMGVLIIFSAGWGIITQGFSLGAILFSKPTLNIEERQFTINNVQINAVPLWAEIIIFPFSPGKVLPAKWLIPLLNSASESPWITELLKSKLGIS